VDLSRPRLVRCHPGTSEGGDWKSMTFGELTSRKSSDCQVWKALALGVEGVGFGCGRCWLWVWSLEIVQRFGGKY
jgi:hypothetical protein